MTSRDEILAAVKQNQPELIDLPALDLFFETENPSDIASFSKVLEAIGGKAYEVNDCSEIIAQINKDFSLLGKRVVSDLPEFSAIAKPYTGTDNHELADVELMILPAHFAVAENGACWISSELFADPIMPFIPQHLILIVKKENVVATMHRAYELIGSKDYAYAAFIAGPSKTADIEQSLVLGAHGPKSMKVFFV